VVEGVPQVAWRERLGSLQGKIPGRRQGRRPGPPQRRQPGPPGPGTAARARNHDDN